MGGGFKKVQTTRKNLPIDKEWEIGDSQLSPTRGLLINEKDSPCGLSSERR